MNRDIVILTSLRTVMGETFKSPSVLSKDRVLANDVIFPWEYNPHRVGLWVIGNNIGNNEITLAAVWAGNEQDALDIAADNGFLDALEVFDFVHQPNEECSQEHAENGSIITRLGNDCRAFNLESVWIEPVEFESLSKQVVALFAEARGACVETLEEI